MIAVRWTVRFLQVILETLGMSLNQNRLLASMDHAEACGLQETLLALLWLNLRIGDAAAAAAVHDAAAVLGSSPPYDYRRSPPSPYGSPRGRRQSREEKGLYVS